MCHSFTFGVVVCRSVGTVPGILGLVWLSFRPKSGSRSKASGRIHESFRGPFLLSRVMFHSFTRQLKTYPTPGRAWFSKSLFLGSKLPQGPGKPFQKVVSGAPTFLGPRGSLDPKNKDLSNHARPGVGYVLSCLFARLFFKVVLGY